MHRSHAWASNKYAAADFCLGQFSSVCRGARTRGLAVPPGGAQAVAAVFGVLVSPWMACHLFGLFFGTRRVLGLGLDKSSPDGLFF